MKKILLVDDSQNWVKYHESALLLIYGDNVIIDKAYSAREANDKITASVDEPYDIIFTDMQMETDFLPFYAGEWFIKQIQLFKEYKDTKIVIISATGNIRQIAEKYSVDFIPKYMCKSVEAYKKVLEGNSIF